MIGVCLKYMMRNYGSQLQARATVKVFEDMGIEYEILDYKKKGVMFKLKAIPRLLNPVVLNNILLARQKKKAMKALPQVVMRNRIFDSYSEEHFAKQTVSIDYYKELQHYANKYSAVITCSDQLWSPAGLGTNFYNLMFVPNHVRKISFASSFGVSRIPYYQRRKTEAFLKRIEFISMRENRGAEIVMELIGRRVPVIMDPVFLYSKEDWKNIVPYQGTYDFPYILCYFLGDNVEYRKRTLEFSKKQEIKIVALNFCNSYLDFDKCFGDIVPYDVSPDRFLNLIRNASFICTDSFHGAAFSIIHHKQFAIFDRYVSESSISRNSRIDSLCENLGLMNVRANGKTDLSEILLKFIDYKDVDNKLLKYKEKAKDYLNIAFDGIASSHF